MTLTDATLNGTSLTTAVPDAAILDVNRQLVGRPRHQRVRVPGRAGGWTFDEEPGDRRLELVIHIASASITARRSAVRDLAAWAEAGTTSQLIVDDEADRYHDAILDDAAATNEWIRQAGDIIVPFLVGPYACAVSATSEAITATSNPDSDSFVAADEVTAEPVVTVTARGGTVTGFTFTMNGDALTWAAGTVLNDGDPLTVNAIGDVVLQSENEDVNLVGAFDEADVDMADVSGTFPLLVAGANTWELSWTGTATSVDIDIVWRRKYR